MLARIGCYCNVTVVDHNVLICLVVHFLCHSLALMISPLIGKSFDLLFDTHFIALDPNTYYISFIDYRDYRAKVSAISHASYFLEVKSCSLTVQINKASLGHK